MEIKLNEIVEKCLDEKFTSGEIEKSISNAIDKSLNDIIDNLFMGYNSPLKTQLEEKLEPVISNAIAKSSMDGFVDKLTIMINKFIGEKEISKVVELNERYSSFDDVLGSDKKYHYGDIVKLSEIFEMYKEWIALQIENLSYNDDDWNYDDGVENVTWNVALEEIEDDLEDNHSYFKSRDRRLTKYKLMARPDNEDNIDDDEYNFDIVFGIRSFYDGKRILELDSNLMISDLTHLPKFILTLFNISSNYVPIEEDKSYFNDFVEATIEREY